MKLTAVNVRSVFQMCMATVEDEHSFRVEGVMTTVPFRRHKVEECAHNIKSMLSDLHDNFFQIKVSPDGAKTGGGGWSFLNACVNRAGEQWGEHQDIDMLLMLGIALSLVEFCMPRKFWSLLPGGVPYFVIKM